MARLSFGRDTNYQFAMHMEMPDPYIRIGPHL